ncbi:cytochrome c oxidase assembly protein CtaG/Cox11-domain-containing protein [Lipomyces oligophaga]|uniref:cytochrome c oxidase assembly protein CtaG/Cox11-domain-containing protein n=1 Tax=Lipomyces oligophaga TaxID=45792 RepID=UPI0034CF937C
MNYLRNPLSRNAQKGRLVLYPAKSLAQLYGRTLSSSSILSTAPSQSSGSRSTSGPESEKKFSRAPEYQDIRINPAILKKLHEKGLTLEDLDELRRKRERQASQSAMNYTLSLIIGTLALAYASVPFYRLLCQQTGWAGTPITDFTRFTPDKLVPVENGRKLTVYFESDVAKSLPWSFEPMQKSVTIAPGETALAFYKARSKADEDIIGVATYNVTPQQVAPYFSKIQCFCFEQQQLHAGEEVDMPIFFFIDPDFDNDPLMKHIQSVVLSYTFFRAKTGPIGKTEQVPVTQVRVPVIAESPVAAAANSSASE